MFKVKLILFVLIFSLFWACKKDELYSSDEAPSLYVACNIDGQNIMFIAGIDGCYNKASFINAGDEGDVGQFTSLFFNISEPLSHERIEFRIRNHTKGPMSVTDLNSVIGLPNHPIYVPESKYYYPVQFTQEISQPTSGYYWDFGDGTNSDSVNPLKYYEVGFQDKYRVTLSSNCADTSISSDVFLPSSPCSAQIEIEPIDTGQSLGYIYRAVVQGRAGIKYQWTLNNDIGATTSEIKYVYPNNSSEIEHIRLSAADANNCSMEIARKLRVGNSTTCFTNFDYAVLPIVQYVDSLGLGQIEVVYTDENQIEYSTIYGPQETTSFFKIISGENYIVNEDGLLTMKLDVEFQCIVYDQQGNFHLLSNANGRVAVAHP